MWCMRTFIAEIQFRPCRIFRCVVPTLDQKIKSTRFESLPFVFQNMDSIAKIFPLLVVSLS